jgi:transcriptional regulator with XRE-family HTH domain
MKTKKTIIFPKHKIILEEMGQNIKLARKRRKITTSQLSERADISRSTLFLIEKGNEGVSIGNYFNVLRMLGLETDFLKLASDDILGRKLQDIELLLKPESEDNEVRKYSHLIKSKLHFAIKKGGYDENSELFKIICCSYDDLVKHLNNNEYGFLVGEQYIDIDHIIPTFGAINKDEVIKLNHYTNLQLLPSFYNRNIKGVNKWDDEHFKIWYKTL